MNRDLFGNEVEPSEDPMRADLSAYDQHTFEDRLMRLKYLFEVYPENYGFRLTFACSGVVLRARHVPLGMKPTRHQAAPLAR
jgi:hypothetical protein